MLWFHAPSFSHISDCADASATEARGHKHSSQHITIYRAPQRGARRFHNSRHTEVLPQNVFLTVKSNVFKVFGFGVREWEANEGPTHSIFVASLPRKHFVAANRRLLAQVSRTWPEINCPAGKWLFCDIRKKKKSWPFTAYANNVVDWISFSHTNVFFRCFLQSSKYLPPQVETFASCETVQGQTFYETVADISLNSEWCFFPQGCAGLYNIIAVLLSLYWLQFLCFIQFCPPRLKLYFI